jgi:hypothetical protein
MSRTKHLTRAEADNKSRPTRARAKTRLTKLGDRLYFGNSDRPKNEGNTWKFGYNSGKRHRKETRQAKVIGRRLERRRLDRSLLP